MWLPRGLSSDGLSIPDISVANHRGVPSQETGGSASGCGCMFFDVSSTQHSNVCHRTAMADTQVLEHSGGSRLDHEVRLL